MPALHPHPHHAALLDEAAQMGGSRRRVHPGPPGQFPGGQRVAVGQRGEHRGPGRIPEQRRHRREVAIPRT